METSPLTSLQRVLGQGGSRRAIIGAAAAAAMTRIGLNHVEAKKKRKKRKKKGRGNGGGNNGGGNNGGGGGNNGGGNGGGGGGGGGNECQFEICGGQCVDIATDPNNCGACGNQCAAGEVCRLDFCVSAIENINGAFGLAVTGGDDFAITAANDATLHLVEETDIVFSVINVPGPAQGGTAQPTGVAVNPIDGSFVVLDTANSRVIRLRANGTVDLEFGSFGTGPVQFEFPEGVAIDPETRQIFVLDKGNGLVKRFSGNNASPLGQFGGTGSGEGRFQQPRGIAIAANRNVVVADTGNNRVQILNQVGEVIRVIGRAGSGDGEFNAPAGVGIRANGGIVVADTGNNRIQFFNADGDFAGALGRGGADLGEFNAPVGVVELPQGFFAVADQGNDRVQILNLVPRL